MPCHSTSRYFLQSIPTPILLLPNVSSLSQMLWPFSFLKIEIYIFHTYHRKQRLCGIKLLGIRIQCWFLHLSERKINPLACHSWLHTSTHFLPNPTHSATGPSSLSSPLIRPTGGLPVWLGQGGGGCSDPSVPPADGRGGLSSLSNTESVLEETGDPIGSEVNSPSTSFSFPLISSFKIRGGKGSKLVSGELLDWS